MTTHFYDDKQDGDLITQIEHWEWADLVAQAFDESIDPLDLVDSDIKKERILGKKLACLMQLAAGDIAAFMALPKRDWVTLYFRKRGSDGLEAELLQRTNAP